MTSLFKPTAIQFCSLILAASTIVIGLALFETTQAQGDPVTIQVQNAAVDPNQSVVVPATIASGNQLVGAMTLVMNYNPAHLTIENCVVADFEGVCNTTTPGEIRIAAVNSQGVSGDSTLANITFTAIGAAGTVTDVTLAEISSFADPNGSTIANYTTVNGQVTINPPTPTPTNTPTPTDTPTPTPTNTPTPTPTNTPTPTPTDTPTPTNTPTPVPTDTPTPVPTDTPTPVPTDTPTPVPTDTPTPVPTDTPTPVPTDVPTDVPPTSTMVVENTATPATTVSPTATAVAPTATVETGATNTPVPTATNTMVPQATSSPTSNVTPSAMPSATPTPLAVSSPAATPDTAPTAAPGEIEVNAELIDDAGVVTWAFTADRQTIWFHVFRAQSANFEDAEQVTEFFFPAPFNGEQDYQFDDSTLTEDGEYYYWVQQVFGNGDTIFHGPDDITVTDDAQDPPQSTATVAPIATTTPFATQTPVATSVPQEPGTLTITDIQADENDGRLQWEFTADQQTIWFRVYRAETEDFDNAEELTVDFIPAHVRGTQAYEFVDGTLPPAGTYYYWIERVIGGAPATLHGPVPLQSSGTKNERAWIYLPFAKQ